MDEEKELTAEESLLVIQGMINKAKQGLAEDDGKIWILWGWLVVLASMGQFAMILLGYEELSSLPWALMFVGGIYTVIYSIKESKKTKVKTHVDEFMKYLWMSFGVSIVLMLYFCSRDKGLIIPMCMVLYGIGTFVSGGVLKFKPLIIGGICCWVLAAVAFHLERLYQMPAISLAVIASYLVPGYMLRANYKRS